MSSRLLKQQLKAFTPSIEGNSNEASNSAKKKRRNKRKSKELEEQAPHNPREALLREIVASVKESSVSRKTRVKSEAQKELAERALKMLRRLESKKGK